MCGFSFFVGGPSSMVSSFLLAEVYTPFVLGSLFLAFENWRFATLLTEHSKSQIIFQWCSMPTVCFLQFLWKISTACHYRMGFLCVFITLNFIFFSSHDIPCLTVSVLHVPWMPWLPCGWRVRTSVSLQPSPCGESGDRACQGQVGVGPRRVKNEWGPMGHVCACLLSYLIMTNFWKW